MFHKILLFKHHRITGVVGARQPLAALEQVPTHAQPILSRRRDEGARIAHHLTLVPRAGRIIAVERRAVGLREDAPVAADDVREDRKIFRDGLQ